MRQFLYDSLSAWTGLMARRPWTVLILSVVLAGASLVYTANNIKMNSDTFGLVDENEPFRIHAAAFEKVFPEYNDVVLIVVDGPSAVQTESAALSLAQALQEESELFPNIYLPGAGQYFRKNGLLYLDIEALRDAVDNLAMAQPALAQLSADPSLRGLFGMLQLGLAGVERGEDLPASFELMAERVAVNGQALLDAEPLSQVALPAAMGVGQDNTTRLIMVQPAVDFSSALSGRLAVERLKEIEVELRSQGVLDGTVDVRFTGDVVLAYDELTTVRDGVQLAGLVSLGLLLIILGFGLRSIRLIVASYSTLFVGFAWTAAFATASVGQLNMISAACAVLFIGLGIDHAIHYCLRYREIASHGGSNAEALEGTSRSVGGAIGLCAVSSAIGFLSFIPTDYQGFAELGIIAGGGMIMALIASFTVLPAMLTVLRAAKIRPHLSMGELLPVDFMARHRGLLAGSVLLLACGAAFVAKDVAFDSSTLNLKNPESESVTTLQELSEKNIVTDYTAMVMTRDMAQAQELAAQLEALPQVDHVVTPYSYIPADQDEKLLLIEEAYDFMWPALNPMQVADEPSDESRMEAARELLKAIEALPEEARTDKLEALSQVLAEILESSKATAMLLSLEAHLTGGISEQLERLDTALSAEPVSFDDLPQDLLARDIAESGEVRISVLPEGNIHDYKELKDFVYAIEEVVPTATGRPVAEVGVGGVIVEAFQLAAIIAVTLIAVMLYAVLRRVTDVLLVLVPMAMAFSLAIATTVIMDMPFNFANIIVLPLLLGFGIDSGIHLVHRRHAAHSVSEVMHSSTPRAITLSALTTIASFGSLSLSSHQGVGSLGVLLGIAMIFIVLCTVIVLPAMMSWRDHLKNNKSQPAG